MKKQYFVLIVTVFISMTAFADSSNHTEVVMAAANAEIDALIERTKAEVEAMKAEALADLKKLQLSCLLDALKVLGNKVNLFFNSTTLLEAQMAACEARGEAIAASAKAKATVLNADMMLQANEIMERALLHLVKEDPNE